MRRALLSALVLLCASCGDGDAPDLPAPVPAEVGGDEPGAAEGERAPALDPVLDADPVPSTPPSGGEDAAAGSGGSGEAAEAVGPVPVRLPAAGERPAFRRPEHVRALYLNAWTAGSSRRMEQLIELARATEVNAFVLDVKDSSGYLSHASGVPLAREVGATGELRVRDLPGLLRRLEAEGIWPIARIVIVQDPVLAAARPDLAIQSVAGGTWVDGKGIVWLNPHDRAVWDYHLDIAEEVARLGFPEIQWDYVRFPDAPRAELAQATFPGATGASKPEVIRAFLEYADGRLDSLGLDVVHTADVFGVTTSARDVGIGQVWERFIDKLDVALPMVYPSHYYRGSFGRERPNFHPYEIVRAALESAVRRTAAVEGAGRVRPWLQDFDLGEPDYGVPEVRAQIQATYDAGLEEWVLWNPGSRYTTGALEPADGWEEEPRIRIANRVVPVSERFAALRLAAAAPAPAEPGAPGAASGTPRSVPAATSPPAVPAADTVRPRVLDRDSLRRWIDSAAVAPDSLR